VIHSRDFERLLDSIADQETGHLPEAQRDSAVGDDGMSVGRYQIQVITVDDVNRILGRKVYTPADRLNPVKSRDMAGIYIRHWVGTLPEEAQIPAHGARIFNGGPRGWVRTSTLKYVNEWQVHWLRLGGTIG